MTDLLPGQILHVLIIGVVDAALLSWVTLVWYRRSILRLMGERAPGAGEPDTIADEPAALPPTPGHPASPASFGDPGPQPRLEFALFETSGDPSRAGRHDRRGWSRAFTRIVLAVMVGAALWSAAMTTLQLAGAGDPSIVWFVRWWVNVWPVVPSLVLLLALDRRRTLHATGAYLLTASIAVMVFTVVRQAVAGSVDTAAVTNVFWLLATLVVTAGPAALILFVASLRRVRAVTPLTLAVLFVFGTASLFVREAVIAAFDIPVLRSVLLQSAELGSATGTYYGLFLVVALPVGLVSWWMLRRIASAFDHKRFSDVQLIVDCFWVVVTTFETSPLALRYGMWAVPAGLAVFGVYRLGFELVLRLLAAQAPEARRLTLLRVFGHQARTESLFDRIAQQWRFRGSVQLIAGPDLAMRTTDPGDVLAFLGSQLALRYVRTISAIPDRMQRLDARPDPDGRFRVNEVYCHDDTWRPALEALLDASDVVLADLRGFRQQNAGCRFELEQLLRRVPAEDVVIVYDASTDLPLLNQLLAGAWNALVREGRATSPGRVVLVRIERHTDGDIRRLTECLGGAGQPDRVVAALA